MDKTSENRPLRVIISGGGTGGHIFPALSIADSLRERNPQTEILFVGADGRMEMEKVPAAGYRITGLPVAGLQRSLSPSNLLLPFKILKSISMAGKIIRDFKPDIAVGVGGYASAPMLWSAQRRGIPTLIQEQNGYAGLTNRILGKKALDPQKKHLFIVGGSLGSGTLNLSVRKWIEKGCPGGENLEILWQCGRYYRPGVDAFMEETRKKPDAPACIAGIRHFDFIQRMDLAYAAADVVISRSGASSISELCAAGKAVIFVPSPNVAEDHQRHNAMALVNRNAAMIVMDDKAPDELMDKASALLEDADRIREMEKNILTLAIRDAADRIVAEIYGITDRNGK